MIFRVLTRSTVGIASVEEMLGREPRRSHRLRSAGDVLSEICTEKFIYKLPFSVSRVLCS